MEWNTFSFQLISFVIFGFVKGYFHLEYLKSVFPEKYGDLNYLKIYMTGTHNKCPQLMLPYIESHSNHNSIQQKKFVVAWIATIVEVLILLSILFMVFG